MGRFLIILGAVLLIVGLAWPWLEKLGFGRLPGDIVIERGNFKFVFPLGTSVALSLILSLVLSILSR